LEHIDLAAFGDVSSLSKAELRELVKREIAAFSDDYIKESDEGILPRVLRLSEFQRARNVLLYRSVAREPGTDAIAQAAIAAGKTVAFPRCLSGGAMQACIVGGLDELVPSKFGIPAPPETATVLAPEKLDLVIVPALAYDSKGHRLGRGGGYYDRFLRDVPATRVGLGRRKLLQSILPHEPHDIIMDWVITEHGPWHVDRFEIHG
jgi:5-formyltetrahydrofolate cyclo-ligase